MFGELREKILRGGGWHAITIPASCLLMAAAGYFLTGFKREDIVAVTALPVCLLVILAIGFSVWTLVRARNEGLASFKRNLPLVILSGFLILLFSILDHRDSKVILDELILQTSALHLTQDNEYRIPQFSHNLNSEYLLQLGYGVPDKRPPMYPVLLSIVHRVLGYSQMNGYILNALLGFGLFFTVGKIGEFLYPRFGGYLAVLGMASMPLLSQNITSQHLEILYLFLISVLMWISLRASIRKSEEEIPLAYLLAAAIALTRYEGLIFFIVPFFLHVHAVLDNRPVGGLKRVYWVCPLAIAFTFALLGHMFNYEGFWQLDDMNNSQPFGPLYWFRNAGAFLNLMLNANRELPGSIALSLLGLASVPVALLHISKSIWLSIRDKREFDEESIPLGIFLLAAIVFLTLLFSYHWGNVDSHITARFALFPYLVLVTLALYAIKREAFWVMIIGAIFTLLCGIQTVYLDESNLSLAYIFVFAGFVVGGGLCLKKANTARLAPALLVFWGLYLTTETLPAINQRSSEVYYVPLWRTKLFLEWVDQYAGTNSVFISDTALYGMLARQSATTMIRFKEDSGILLSLKEKNRVSNLYALQETWMDEEGSYHASDKWQLPTEILYEVVDSRRITDDYGVRIVRITGKKTAGQPEISPSAEQPAFADPEG